MDKADELIRRCIHPRDDIAARNLHDIERRWFYVVFLQALGAYLHVKTELGQFDAGFEYARASLLHYARWMVVHERPFLERRTDLEFPNETWAAQDLRKADVLLYAAQYTAGAERARFLERARFFFDYSVNALRSTPKHHYTRPLILVLSNGLREGWFQKVGASLTPSGPPPGPGVGTPPRAFVPQRVRAMRRAIGFSVLAVVSAIGLLSLLIL